MLKMDYESKDSQAKKITDTKYIPFLIMKIIIIKSVLCTNHNLLSKSNS